MCEQEEKQYRRKSPFGAIRFRSFSPRGRCALFPSIGELQLEQAVLIPGIIEFRTGAGGRLERAHHLDLSPHRNVK